MTNLQNTLQKNLLEIFTAREEIFSDWKKLSSMDAAPPYLNLSLLECCHFSEPMPLNSASLPPCTLCSFERKLSNYELLVSRPPQETEYVFEEIKMKSSTETILNAIYEFAKKNQLPVTMLEDGRRHIGQFCDLKNEIGVNFLE